MKTKPITVDVTAKDIARGRRLANNGGLKSLNCPIAQALRRATGAKGVSVGCDAFSLDFKRMSPLPAEAIAFIEAFDNKLPVKPMTFTVPYPKPQSTKES